MAFVKKGDVFVPEMLAEALEGAYAGMVAFKNTGVATINTSFPGAKEQVGDIVKIPYFGNIGEFEDLVTDGDALTPKGVVTSVEQATVQHSGIAIEASKWAQLSGVEDPYKEMAKQIITALQRKIDKVLIDLASSAFTGVLTSDSYSSTTPSTLGYDAMINGRLQWGDESDNGAKAVVMHSKVKGDLYKAKDAIGRPLLLEPQLDGLDKIAGVPIVVTDRMPVSADTPKKYTSLLCKEGSMIFWMNGNPVVETDRDILADTDIAALHIYYAAHAYKRMPGLTKPGIVQLTTN